MERKDLKVLLAKMDLEYVLLCSQDKYGRLMIESQESAGFVSYLSCDYLFLGLDWSNWSTWSCWSQWSKGECLIPAFCHPQLHGKMINAYVLFSVLFLLLQGETGTVGPIGSPGVRGAPVSNN